ncbi:MAG: hypothetical protein ACTHJ2_04600, partial [Candidatus Nitrosocosmicus sp.]
MTYYVIYTTVNKENNIHTPLINRDSETTIQNYNEVKDVINESETPNKTTTNNIHLKKDIRILIVDDEKDIVETFKEIILFE